MDILQALKNAQVIARSPCVSRNHQQSIGEAKAKAKAKTGAQNPSPSTAYVQTLGALEGGAQFLPAKSHKPPSRNFALHWFWGDWKDAGRVGKFGQELRATAPRALKAAVSQSEVEALGGAQGQDAVRQEARKILAASIDKELLQNSLDKL